MASYSDYLYRINGVVNTGTNVMENLDTLAGACNTWMSYDSHEGLWSVVINQEGDSVASFDDSNIVGAISVSGSGLEQLYNSVRVEFPHIDLNDTKDFIHDTIPSADFFPNEIYNVLSLNFDVINDPVQAEYVGLVQLKQNRLDKTIRFTTDFSQIGLKAGDLIDVTSETYGFDATMFRIVSLTESDQEDGNILISITAQEYDSNVYSTDDLFRYTRENSTGIATVGNIGIPGTPEVNKTEKDARPRVTISSTTPTGIVEGLEFWATTDTYILDENRNYYLLDTVRPSQGNTFTFGTEVSITNDTLSSGNLYVKTRGINSQTVGSFSTPAGFVYTPVQTTNNIDESTTVSTSTGGLVTALGALALLNNLDGLFSGNTASGSLFKKVFDLFNDETGTDILTNSPVTSVDFGYNALSLGWTSTNTNGSVILELGDAPIVTTSVFRFNFTYPGTTPPLGSLDYSDSYGTPFGNTDAPWDASAYGDYCKVEATLGGWTYPGEYPGSAKLIIGSETYYQPYGMYSTGGEIEFNDVNLSPLTNGTYRPVIKFYSSSGYSGTEYTVPCPVTITVTNN